MYLQTHTMSYRTLLDDCSRNYSPEVRFYNSDLPFDTIPEFFEWAVSQSKTTEDLIECIFGMLLKGDLVNLPVKQLTKRLTSVLESWYRSVYKKVGLTDNSSVNEAKQQMIRARYSGAGHGFADATRTFTAKKKEMQRLHEERPGMESVEYACSRYLLNRMRAYHREVKMRFVDIAYDAWRASLTFEHPRINFHDYFNPSKYNDLMRVHVYDRALLSDVSDPHAFYEDQISQHKLKSDNKLITASSIHFT